MLELLQGRCQTIISEPKYTFTHWLTCTCSLSKPYAYARNVHIYLCLFLPHSSSVSKIGISVMSSAAGDNKLVEEPITSRWQAGGSGLSTCHYLHIDISKSPDRPFLRLPWQATMINPGKRKEGRKTQSRSERLCLSTLSHSLPHAHTMWKHARCTYRTEKTTHFLCLTNSRHRVGRFTLQMYSESESEILYWSPRGNCFWQIY